MLTIPHVEMENRMFVLKPLSQLCPGRRHPILGKTVMQLKNELSARGGDDAIVGKVKAKYGMLKDVHFETEE